MKRLIITPAMLLILFITACVTINVYFPAAAAENAANILIRDIYGIDKEDKSQDKPDPGGAETSAVNIIGSKALSALLNFLVPAAHAAQPDINISSPGINKLKGQMKKRHRTLSPFYKSGAVGMENNGFISIRNAKSIPLKERNTVKKLIADENRDRNTLYVEIANANGHPEWAKEIRDIFARRWVGNAPAGWWYKGAGGKWQQK